MFNFNKIGLLGINARNLSYIRPYNSKKAVKLADDKIRTKQFLSARDIPVPKLFHIIKDSSQLEKFDFNILPDKFVLKPNYGYGGEGIIVITSKNDRGFVTSSGRIITVEMLKSHIEDIIDGRFSLSNQSDTAFFEQLIECEDTIAQFAHKGLPDIRIVVHNLIPVMAMLRLPTDESDGKANLHLGAIGVGIDIATGRATHIMHHNKIIDVVPGKGDIRDLVIPYWDQMLLIASKIQLTTNLGYLAVDLVVDKHSGPVLLEMNARAGLAVQIANLAPLRRRLERIKGIKVLNPEKGVRVAQDMFGNKLHKEIKSISGKEVIGVEEDVSLFLPDGGSSKLKAHINTTLETTLIDSSYAALFKSEDDESDDSVSGDVEKIKIKFSLADQRVQTLAVISDLSDKPYKLVIGRKEVSNHFLIDPAKKGAKKLPDKNTSTNSDEDDNKAKVNFAEVDKTLNSLDSQIKLLYHLKPTNLEEEKEKFFNSDDYNPQFTYPDLKFDLHSFKNDLSEVILDESNYGRLFKEKKEEMYRKVMLLEKRGTKDFMKWSIELYGFPSQELIKQAEVEMDEILKQHVKDGQQLDDEGNGDLDSDDAIKEFNKIFKKYGIIWKAKAKENLVARCIAGKKNSLFVRKDAVFAKNRIKALVAHEIETHILSAENGKRQPYMIFNRGTARYLETQEGLAIYNTNLVLKDDSSFFNVVPHAIARATIVGEKGSFRDIYNFLKDLGFSDEKSFRIALKLKRGIEDTSQGGVFTKDFIYYKGFKDIESFVDKGGNLKDLYIGKISVHDIDWIKHLSGIKKPRYIPKWLP